MPPSANARTGSPETVRSLGCVATRSSGMRDLTGDPGPDAEDATEPLASPESDDEDAPSSPASTFDVNRDISMDAGLGLEPLPFARDGFACHPPEAWHVPARGVVKKRSSARRGFPTPPGAWEASSRARFHALGGRATPRVCARHVVITGWVPRPPTPRPRPCARRDCGASDAESDAKIVFGAPETPRGTATLRDTYGREKGRSETQDVMRHTAFLARVRSKSNELPVL